MISIISPVRNEAENLPLFYTTLVDVTQTLFYQWEFIFVYDESKDNTFEVLLELRANDPRVKIVKLSRGFGKENAMTAGLDFATGHAAILIDADLQDPPGLIIQMLELWEKGNKMVYAVRKKREGESWFKKQTASWFYSLMEKISTVHIPRNTGDFRLIDRLILDDLKSLQETQRFMKGLFMVPGYQNAPLYYQRKPRHLGQSNFGFWKLWSFAIDGITGFSLFPLQIASIFGVFLIFVSLFFGVPFLIFNPLESCDRLLVAIIFFSGVQLATIGILGEYIGRTYFESKKRPRYFVESTIGFE